MKVLFQKTNLMMNGASVTNHNMIITEMLKIATAPNNRWNILKTDYSIENDDSSIRTNTVISFIEENVYETPIKAIAT